MIELVVARYNEDISWLGALLNRVAVKITIYNKGEPIKGLIKGYHELSNVGRESHTYLWHIYQNWHNLADWTVFTQGDPEPHISALEFATLLSPAINGVKGANKTRLAPELKNGRLAWCLSYQKNLESGTMFPAKLSLEEYFRTYIPPINLDEVLYFGGAIFGVPKCVLQRHPQSLYRNLCETLAHHINPEESHYIERAWYALFNTRSNCGSN